MNKSLFAQLSDAIEPEERLVKQDIFLDTPEVYGNVLDTVYLIKVDSSELVWASNGACHRLTREGRQVEYIDIFFIVEGIN